MSNFHIDVIEHNVSDLQRRVDTIEVIANRGKVDLIKDCEFDDLVMMMGFGNELKLSEDCYTSAGYLKKLAQPVAKLIQKVKDEYRKVERNIAEESGELCPNCKKFVYVEEAHADVLKYNASVYLHQGVWSYCPYCGHKFGDSHV